MDKADLIAEALTVPPMTSDEENLYVLYAYTPWSVHTSTYYGTLANAISVANQRNQNIDSIYDDSNSYVHIVIRDFETSRVVFEDSCRVDMPKIRVEKVKFAYTPFWKPWARKTKTVFVIGNVHLQSILEKYHKPEIIVCQQFTLYLAASDPKDTKELSHWLVSQSMKG